VIDELIQELMKKMKVSEEQAKGGLGLLLKFCQEKLSHHDFKKITDLVGNGWHEILKNAPDSSKNLMGRLGGFASKFNEKLGAMAHFAGGFKSLDIEAAKIQEFVNVTLKHLKEKGGPQVKELLDKFLG